MTDHAVPQWERNLIERQAAEGAGPRVLPGDPFGYGEQTKPRAFIQWKGTSVCLDFYCDCGTQGHFDGDFAYQLRCPACGTVWEMPWNVFPRRGDGDAGTVRDIDVSP